MLDTEKELNHIQRVVESFKHNLINKTLDINSALTQNISEKNLNKLKEELRLSHRNLEAAQYSLKILSESPPIGRFSIREAIFLSDSDKKEQRDNHRHRIFWEEFRNKALDNKFPSEYLMFLSLFMDELYAIRDSVDPPTGDNFRGKLRELEEHIILDRYKPAIIDLIASGMSQEDIANKLNITINNIEFALSHNKEDTF